MKRKIQIVDDDPRNRRLLVDLLTLKGYAVIESHNGREGVEHALAFLPDLILMDIQMPGLDGFEAIRTLKHEATTRRIPIWALTSYALQAERLRIQAEGCDDYLTKPFDVPDLLRRIEALLSDPLYPENANAVITAGTVRDPSIDNNQEEPADV